jgi:hypothetical protein
MKRRRFPHTWRAVKKSGPLTTDGATLVTSPLPDAARSSLVHGGAAIGLRPSQAYIDFSNVKD